MMYTTMYMRLINVRNRTQEKWSFYHMNIQYQRMLSFMNEDGSFSLFRSDWYACYSKLLNIAIQIPIIEMLIDELVFLQGHGAQKRVVDISLHPSVPRSSVLRVGELPVYRSRGNHLKQFPF